MRKILLVTVLGAMLAGCSGINEREKSPASIGIDRDALKKSPCACMKYYDYNTKTWVRG